MFRPRAELRLLTAAAAAAAGALFPTRAALASPVPPVYHLVDLGTLGGTSSQAEGISPSGLVTGQSLVAGDTATHAFLYDGTLHDLGAYNGYSTYADAVNDNGQVAGYIKIPSIGGFYPYHAARYDSTGWHDLHTAAAATFTGNASMATGINAAGTVAGWTYLTPGSTQCDGFTYDTAAHRLNGYYGIAITVDDANRTVGYNYTVVSGQWRAIAFWNNGSFHYLGTLGGTFSQAVAINGSDQICGDAKTAAGDTHAFLYDGTMHDLGNLAAGKYSSATWINSLGQVCGVSALDAADTVEHGFLYSGGALYDLNDLLDAPSAWTITVATSMNANGQIVGIATNAAGAEHAVLLNVVVPEPALSLVLPALLCLGRRRRR